MRRPTTIHGANVSMGIPKRTASAFAWRKLMARFRVSGDGGQTRVDAALKDWFKTHSSA